MTTSPACSFFQFTCPCLPPPPSQPYSLELLQYLIDNFSDFQLATFGSFIIHEVVFFGVGLPFLLLEFFKVKTFKIQVPLLSQSRLLVAGILPPHLSSHARKPFLIFKQFVSRKLYAFDYNIAAMEPHSVQC